AAAHPASAPTAAMTSEHRPIAAPNAGPQRKLRPKVFPALQALKGRVYPPARALPSHREAPPRPPRSGRITFTGRLLAALEKSAQPHSPGALRSLTPSVSASD